MRISWGTLSKKSRQPLLAGWVIAAALISLYLGVIAPRERVMGISSERTSGLAATASWEPASLWRQSSISSFLEGTVGGVPGYAAADKVGMPATTTSAPDDRQIVRNGAMDLIVNNPRDSSEKIRQLAENLGGFLVTSESYGADAASRASLTVRIPAARFEQARGEIRKLGLRVEGEKLEAQDVTRQYVDQSARLRNLRAQETQYLGILKQAKTVNDTLEVSDKLNRVRGEIEQQQAEFDALSKQVETVGLTISLRAEADTQVFGLHWRPLYQLKVAARQGIESLADYASAMASFVFFLPSALLWLGTILVGAAAGWRILRWAGRLLFMPRDKAVPVQA